MKKQLIRILKFFRNYLQHAQVRILNKTKVFVIGMNKTGTTSLHKFLQDLGYRTGPQKQCSRLLHDYFDGNWNEYFRIIKNYEAFQDSPFSMASNEFILEIKNKYPNALFILTVRDDSTVWYQSLVRFHRKIRYGDMPSIEWSDVRKIEFSGRKVDRSLLHYHGLDNLPPYYDRAPYDSEILQKYYNDYNERLISLLSSSPNFMIVNLNDQDAEHRIKSFLGKETSTAKIPKLNRSV